jgi:trigger factor
MQRLDAATGTPIVGEKEEDISFFVDDETLKEALREGLIGKKAEERFRVELPVEEGEEGEDSPANLLVLPSGETTGTRTNPYQVFVKEVKQRELPEMDEEFIREMTGDDAEDEAGLRAFIKSQIERSQNRESRELLDSELMNLMMDLHDFPVPSAATELFLNSFVEDLRQRHGQDLPDNFDLRSFREANRSDAERQARWKLIKDVMVKKEGLEVTDEDRHTYFLELSRGKEEGAASFEQYYKALDGMMDRLDQQLLSRKLFELIASRVKLDEMDKDAYLEALKTRHEKLQAESA